MTKDQGYSDKIKHVFDLVSLYDDVATFLASIENVPRPLLLLYAAHFCLSEVHNGGFLQLFWNSTGALLPESIEGYRALGMPSLAATFASAAALLGSPYPRDRDERRDALLQASKYTEDELTAIFQCAQNLYLGFVEATVRLPIDLLNRQAWKLAESENGGFQERAVVYAEKLG